MIATGSFPVIQLKACDCGCVHNTEEFDKELTLWKKEWLWKCTEVEYIGSNEPYETELKGNPKPTSKLKILWEII